MLRVCEEALRRERSVKLGCKAQSQMSSFVLVAEIECSARCARSQSPHSTRRIPRHFAKPQCRGKSYQGQKVTVRSNKPLLAMSSNGKLRLETIRVRWTSACYQERVERATSEPPHAHSAAPSPRRLCVKNALSRSRFHQLLQSGVFPKPAIDPESKRPFYDSEGQAVCLQVRQAVVERSMRRTLTADPVSATGRKAGGLTTQLRFA